MTELEKINFFFWCVAFDFSLSFRPAAIWWLKQMVKNLPAMQAIWVQSLCLEDPLEKKMATPSSILAWRTP